MVDAADLKSAACNGRPGSSPGGATKILNREELKNIPVECKNCSKIFKNIFSASAHYAHCTGKNSTKHLDKKRNWKKNKFDLSVDEIFAKDSRLDTGRVKKILIALKLRVYECEICKCKEWQGKALVLELDHINGDNKDHRLENIRLLCPNCHSQTPNFRGRNKNLGKKFVDDKTLKQELQTNNIRNALLNVGMVPSGTNYARCKKLSIQIRKENV